MTYKSAAPLISLFVSPNIKNKPSNNKGKYIYKSLCYDAFKFLIQAVKRVLT